MKDRSIMKIGGILFFIGFILIILSWNYSYPISILSINDITFTQFSSIFWPGLLFGLIGLFLLGHYSEYKTIKVFCAAIFPTFLYIYVSFFSYLPSSDSGTARGMFHVFQKTGIDPEVLSYFEFPTYFSLNKVINEIIAFDEKGIALISIISYGIILGMFLYLFYSSLKNQEHNQFTKLIPFLLVIIYFVGIFPFLNYQWVPQTLALCYLFILIYISTYISSYSNKTQWTIIFNLVFITLIFSHAFISIFFILFLGLLTFKKKHLVNIFLTIVSIYIIITILYTTLNFTTYIDAFESFTHQLGGEYSNSIVRSLRESESLTSQIISLFNRINVPVVWMFSFFGTIILFFKKKIDFVLIALGLAGGFYLAIGLFYNTLGMRATQIFLIPIIIGFMFFISKWRKVTIVLIIIIIVLSTFGPMRVVYNNTHFQTDEEANALNFLSRNIINKTNPRIATSQVNYGYLMSRHKYFGNTPISIIRPGESIFLDIFNGSLNKDDYIFYNSNLGKEILNAVLNKEEFIIILMEVMDNNKIYNCGITTIINGMGYK